LEALVSNPISKIVYFPKDDIEANLLMYVFKSLKFEYSQMSGQIISYNYDKLKDNLKWNGLDKKSYVPLIDAMFSRFLARLKN